RAVLDGGAAAGSDRGRMTPGRRGTGRSPGCTAPGSLLREHLEGFARGTDRRHSVAVVAQHITSHQELSAYRTDLRNNHRVTVVRAAVLADARGAPRGVEGAGERVLPHVLLQELEVGRSKKRARAQHREQRDDHESRGHGRSPFLASWYVRVPSALGG